MNSLGILSLIAAALELTVPVYSLRLIRRFGSSRVGWFLVTAFSSLALLHLVERFKTNAVGPQMLDMIVAFVSGLLLIGMGHVATLCAQRLETELNENKLSTNWQLALNEKTADLARTNQELLDEIARHTQGQRVLLQSEQQSRFLFTESPQPQWIFDLRSLRFLAVNRAALRLLGFTSEEFMALTASRLLPAEAVPLFLRYVAEPCSKAEPRGLWLLGKKNGTLIEVQMSGLDLSYDGCLARLIVANDLAQHPRREPQQLEADEIETISQTGGRVARFLNNIVPSIDSQPKLLLHKSPDFESVEERGQISAAATRAATATCQLLSLAGLNSIQPEPVEPHGPSLNLSHMARGLVGQPVAFPLAPTSPATAQKQSPPLTSPVRETILLVEPHDQTRGLARFILSRQGYHVIEADCSSTVLTLWESQAPSVDLLLTDLALPEGISGWALADELRQTKPALKVVYTSDAVTGSQDQELPQGHKIISKPYTPDKLLQVIRNCLPNC